MNRPEILVVTRDLALAHAVTLAAPGEWTESCESLGSALAAITPDTRLLVVDATLDPPLARLLATLFVDRQAGRRVVLIQPQGAPPLHVIDDRITVLSWPVSPGALAQAVGNATLATWMTELEASVTIPELVTA